MNKILFSGLLLVLNIFVYAYQINYQIDPASSSLRFGGYYSLEVNSVPYRPVGGANPGDSGSYNIQGDISYPLTVDAITCEVNCYSQSLTFTSSNNLDNCNILYYTQYSNSGFSEKHKNSLECDSVR